jgi:hypothetical protein
VLTLVAPVPGLTLAQNLVGMAIGLVLLWLFHRGLAGDRLVVAESGILLGSFLPLMTPFRLRWSEIDTTTVRFLGSFDRAFAVLGTGYSSAVRATRGVGVALSLAGPGIGEARLGGLGSPFLSAPDASTGGNMWFFGCGERQRPALAAALLSALGEDRHPGLRNQLDQVVELSGDPRTCAAQIPGLRLPSPTPLR